MRVFYQTPREVTFVVTEFVRFVQLATTTVTGVSVAPGRANTIVGRLTEECQTVHMKELTDLPKNDQEDPTEVFTDIHFWGRSAAHEAYHLSHGSYQ